MATGITSSQHDNLVQAINRFAQAQVADSWKGAGDPGDAAAVELELHQATADLDRLLTDLALDPLPRGRERLWDGS